MPSFYSVQTGSGFRKALTHKAHDTEHSGKIKSRERCGEVIVHRTIVDFRHRL